MVNYLIPNDLVLRHLFTYERIECTQLCLTITRMGEWARTFDMLMFSFVLKLNVIVIGNYFNGFFANNMYQ